MMIVIKKAEFTDLRDILILQKNAYQSEAELYNDYSIPPLMQPLEDAEAEYDRGIVLKAVEDGRIVGSVRGYKQDDTCYVGKLIVHPKYQNMGIGSSLLDKIEGEFSSAARYELFTGDKSIKNLYMYKKSGYQQFHSESVSSELTMVYLEKTNSREQVQHE